MPRNQLFASTALTILLPSRFVILQNNTFSKRRSLSPTSCSLLVAAPRTNTTVPRPKHLVFLCRVPLPFFCSFPCREAQGSPILGCAVRVQYNKPCFMLQQKARKPLQRCRAQTNDDRKACATDEQFRQSREINLPVSSNIALVSSLPLLATPLPDFSCVHEMKMRQSNTVHKPSRSQRTYLHNLQRSSSGLPL